MDSTMNKVDFPEIKFNTIENLQTYKPLYRKDMDVFYLKPEPNRPATSYDLNGLIWLRIDIETGDIVGVQIDDFESVFLKKYPKLAKTWKETKPLYAHKTNKRGDNSKEPFMLILIDFLKSLSADCPQQLRAEIVPA
jgi:hypothetical protein